MQYRKCKNMFSTAVLKKLAEAGSVSKLSAQGIPGGFLLYATVGLQEAAVTAYRGQPRVFKRLDAVAKYARDIGIDRFEVHLKSWSTQKSLI